MYYKVSNEIDKKTGKIHTTIQPLDEPFGEIQGNTLRICEQDLAELIYTLFSRGLLSFMKLMEQKDLWRE